MTPFSGETNYKDGITIWPNAGKYVAYNSDTSYVEIETASVSKKTFFRAIAIQDSGISVKFQAGKIYIGKDNKPWTESWCLETFTPKYGSIQASNLEIQITSKVDSYDSYFSQLPANGCSGVFWIIDSVVILPTLEILIRSYYGKVDKTVALFYDMAMKPISLDTSAGRTYGLAGYYHIKGRLRNSVDWDFSQEMDRIKWLYCEYHSIMQDSWRIDEVNSLITSATGTPKLIPKMAAFFDGGTLVGMNGGIEEDDNKNGNNMNFLSVQSNSDETYATLNVNVKNGVIVGFTFQIGADTAIQFADGTALLLNNAVDGPFKMSLKPATGNFIASKVAQGDNDNEFWKLRFKTSTKMDSIEDSTTLYIFILGVKVSSSGVLLNSPHFLLCEIRIWTNLKRKGFEIMLLTGPNIVPFALNGMVDSGLDD